MSNFQPSNQTSDSTFIKLQEVDSGLASQEAQLLSQLASVREKRQSLQTVINLFATADTSTSLLVEESAQPNRETETIVQVPEAERGETSQTTVTTQLPSEATLANAQPPSTPTSPSAARSNRTTKRTPIAQTTKQASGWQQYVRDEFQSNSLPEAVNSILQRQAKQVFEIPDVVDAIFEGELPKDVRDKARHQITNILAEGARKNKWHRARAGTYSMSRSTAKANSKS